MFTTSDFGKTPGATETPAATNTADGIRFTVTGLSPISVGWTAPDPERPTDPGRPGTGGGSGSSGYTVTVTKPEHGKVTASPSSGSTVTLTVTPDSGYVLDALAAADSQGNEIKLTAQSGGKYTFTMSSRSVTIKASFVPCREMRKSPARAERTAPPVRLPTWTACERGTMRPWTTRNNLMGGYGGGKFGPNDNITREQLAASSGATPRVPPQPIRSCTSAMRTRSAAMPWTMVSSTASKMDGWVPRVWRHGRRWRRC